VVIRSETDRPTERTAAWHSRLPISPPKPRAVPLIVSLILLAAWIAFLIYAALA